jgi:cholesterol oxidase
MKATRTNYDAIIVGSGFGGGVSACRLAEAGWRVCVLERGRRFEADDFEDGVEHVPDMLWHPDLNPGGIYELRMFQRGAVLCAAGVGGGSLVYANVQLSASPETFALGWPAGTDRSSLDPYYARVEEALEPRPVPDPAPAKVEAFAGLAGRVGREAERVPLAVHFGDDRVNPFGGRGQSGCTNLGRCMTGCPRHAKNTIDLTYLARAEQHGAEVRPLHEVIRLRPPRRAGGRWDVAFRNLETGQEGRVMAKTVVLSAGTLGTNRLLLNNRDALPRLSAMLGKRFSGNGNALGAIYDPSAPGASGVEPTIGPSITSLLDFWRDRGFVIEDGGLSSGLISILDVVRGASAIEGLGRHVLRVLSLGTHVGLEDRLVTPHMVRAKQNGHHLDNTFAFLFIGRDSSNGTLRRNWLGRLEIDMDPDDSRLLFDRMEETLEEMGAAVGGEPTFALEPGPFGRFLIGHALGGCVMADRPEEGVVDAFGRPFGYEQERLRILDGSIVPTAIGVNPSKTIAALTERGVEHLIEEER